MIILNDLLDLLQVFSSSLAVLLFVHIALYLQLFDQPAKELDSNLILVPLSLPPKFIGQHVYLPQPVGALANLIFLFFEQIYLAAAALHAHRVQLLIIVLRLRGLRLLGCGALEGLETPLQLVLQKGRLVGMVVFL